MPNFIEIGEAALALASRKLPSLTDDAAKIAAREGTTLLERSGFLSAEMGPALKQMMNGGIRTEFPAMQRALAANAAEDLLVFGRPTESVLGAPRRLMVYEPHRNISFYPNGEYGIATATPSGQRLMIERFSSSQMPQSTRYVERLKDSYVHVPDRMSPGMEMTSHVITQNGSRQLSLRGGWILDHTNFVAPPETVAAVQALKPLQVADQAIERELGKWVPTSSDTGWLIGFDKRAGEAIVTFDEWASADFAHSTSSNSIVKSLDGFYPIQLRAYKGDLYTAYRNPLGQIFSADKIEGGYRLSEAGRTFAFKPSEVNVGRYASPISLSRALGIDKDSGLRAMGGFATWKTGKIPIVLH